ncbi:winged helix-turn-helix transcriptional regulator [Agromyces aerolatus]|uniref:winged helix-turn-helix transcriptional regulator n=1 Tax=Agromyces sp. LY-1074 TaxID=3074080 RepID=UPI002860B04F|nr:MULTISPECIES: helix-turn-helix domain-containing protein [unclassified Agromyces]MDR5699153.1 helix-turn-helix domain-containing protein [Agromyces sp. LY-1074]MDR5705448.1 helix-turn-helix domain-containing protein [Agromyces sp. LY-1358]
MSGAHASIDELARHRSSTRLHELGQIDEEACRRFTASVEFAGRKWNAAILLAGVRGARRFSEYRAHIAGISDRLLAARLRELEGEGLIERHVRATTPVSVSYTPSSRAIQLIELLQPLAEWGHAQDTARDRAASSVE